MKKGILFTVFILLVSFSGFVYASIVEDANGAYDIEIELNEGWNMIAGTILQNGLSEDSEIQLKDISVMWYYSPFHKDYVEIYPNTDSDKIYRDDDDFVLTTAMWIYSKKSGTIKYNTLEDYPTLENRQLISGWNFVTITPDMFYEKEGQEVFSWVAVKGECNLEKIYAWNHETQDWMSISLTQESIDFNDFLGYGMVVKVSSDCNLGTPTGNADGPPGLPSGDSNSFPESLGNFVLEEEDFNEEECRNIKDSSDTPDGITGETCTKSTVLKYFNPSTDKVVFVHLVEISKGLGLYVGAYGILSELITVGSNDFFQPEGHELAWFSSSQFDLILTQEAIQESYENGISYNYQEGATGDNPVIDWFVDNYPIDQNIMDSLK